MFALYSADACMSVLSPLLEMFTLSIADFEKLFDKADSSSFDLNTPAELAPVTATLTSFFNLATYLDLYT